METLKDELQLVAEKKLELERRLTQSMRERDSLNAALEEASDRIHSLERHAREQETKLQVMRTQANPICNTLCWTPPSSTSLPIAVEESALGYALLITCMAPSWSLGGEQCQRLRPSCAWLSFVIYLYWPLPLPFKFPRILSSSH